MRVKWRRVINTYQVALKSQMPKALMIVALKHDTIRIAER